MSTVSILKARAKYRIIVLLIFLVFSANQVYAQSLIDSLQADSTLQNTKSEVISPKKELVLLKFLKENAENGPDSILFNSIILKNIYDKPINGDLKINLPEGWSLTGLTSQNINFNLAVGEEKRIPIWISIDKNAYGDYSYVITAIAKHNLSLQPETFTAYVKIPKVAKWSMVVPSNVIYFNNKFKYAPFSIKIKNEGNAVEAIRLNLKAGANLRIRDFEFPEDDFYFEILPHKDTCFTFDVKYENETGNLVSTGKENSITIVAENSKKIVKSVIFQKLPSYYQNPVFKNGFSPLTVEVMSQNILNADNPIFNVFLSGQVLLPRENNDIYYRFSFLNVSNGLPYGFGGNIWRYSFLYARLRTKKLIVELGDINPSGFDLRTTARGGKITYKINDFHRLSASVGENIFFPATAYGLDYSGVIRKGVNYKIGASRFNDRFNLINRENVGGSVTARLFKTNSFTLRYGQGRRTHLYDIGDFTVVEDENRSFTGSHIGGDHKLILNRFTSTTSADRYSQYYAGNVNNTTQLRNSLSYRATDKLSLNSNAFYVNTFQYEVLGGRRIPAPEYEVISLNGTANYRFNSQLYGGLGGVYNNSSLTNFYPLLNDRFTNETDNYALNARLSYKISAQSNISLFYQRGFYRPISIYEDPRRPSTFDFNQTYPSSRFSATYRKRQNGVTAIFIRGILNPNQLQSFITLKDNQTYILRPFYNHSFLNERLLVEAFANILIQTASSTEKYTLNLRPTLFLNKGWSAKAFVNYNVGNRKFSDNETVTNRSLFLTVGVKKEFDIQQPRVKYYDLNVIYFKDKNGNGIKDENEPLLENIVTRIYRAVEKNIERKPKGKFQEMDMISNRDGRVTYAKIPEGDYMINFFGLEKQLGLYNPKGSTQQITIFSNTTLYIPLMEGFKVMGQVSVERDPNSSLGKLPLQNIPILATDTTGKQVKSLTNNAGQFQIFVPPTPGAYKISLANVFGENYVIEQQEFLINFNGLKTFQVTFKVIEKQRQINTNGGYQFKSLNGNSSREEVKKPSTEKAKKETPSVNKDVEDKLWDKANDLQRQIDELRKLKQEIENIQTSQQKTLEELKKAKAQLDSAQKQIDNSITNLPASTDNGKLGDQIIPNNMEQYDELDNLIDQLIEKTNPRINYRVEFGVFTEKMPISFLNQLIKFGNIETSQNDDGSSTFKSKPFDTEAEAQEYADYLQKTGMSKISVIGEINGKKAALNEVKELQNK